MSKNESFVIGQTVKFRSEWRVDGTLTTPSTYVITVQDPSGNDATPTVSVDSTGKLSASYAIDEEGYWKYKWVGTGSAAGVKEGTFYCHGSALS